jgi:hypothetical protein
MHRKLIFLIPVLAAMVHAQGNVDSPATTKQILERLENLEKENRALVEEVRMLRQEIHAAHDAAPPPPATANPEQAQQTSLEDRVAVEERRTAEQAQTKVEAAHKFPIQLDGMLLFNAFANSTTSMPESEYLLTGPNTSGATLRQTLLGLNFQGPSLPGDGKVNGFLMMDFFGGYADPQAIRLRLRRAGLSLDWKNRSFSVAQDKPLISPYQPDSLAEVGIPPLAGAGNLWLWLPQAKYEERLHFGSDNGLTAQLAAIQTDESYTTPPYGFTGTVEPARPALEGRFAFWHKFDDVRRFEIAPGFHVSTSHIAGQSVSSHLGSLDWLFVPSSHIRFTGTFFKGQNLAGLGSLGNGFAVAPNGEIHPVDSTGGWAQLAFPVTSRLTFNVFSGIENDSSEYLRPSSLVRNWTYASNVMYHLGPNVIVSLEALQMRARTVAAEKQLQNHFDLALGYVF